MDLSCLLLIKYTADSILLTLPHEPSFSVDWQDSGSLFIYISLQAVYRVVPLSSTLKDAASPID